MQRGGEDGVALLGAEGAEGCADSGCEEGHVVTIVWGRSLVGILVECWAG